MAYGKFILFGEDKKTLALIKNTLVSNGHVFIGYTGDTSNILRYIRGSGPELVFIEAGPKFKDIRHLLDIIDEDLLSACILIMESRYTEILEYLEKSKAMAYLTKPVFDEALLQISDMALMNFRRIIEYEQRMRKLNETLECRKIVERAKWILVEKEGYTESKAYDEIRKKSRDNRMPMKEIAEAIILTRN